MLKSVSRPFAAHHAMFSVPQSSNVYFMFCAGGKEGNASTNRETSRQHVFRVRLGELERVRLGKKGFYSGSCNLISRGLTIVLSWLAHARCKSRGPCRCGAAREFRTWGSHTRPTERETSQKRALRVQTKPSATSTLRGIQAAPFGGGRKQHSFVPTRLSTV